jgi:hypothetical protein
MLEWWSPLSSTAPFIVRRGQGVLVVVNEAVERQGVSIDRPLHRFAIQRWWMVAGWRLHAPMAVALVRKAVWRSVWPLQVCDGGPSNPRQLNLHLWIKPTWINAGEAVWRLSRGSMMWQGGGVVTRHQVASVDVALWAHGPLPRPLAFYARLLSIFVNFPAYK